MTLATLAEQLGLNKLWEQVNDASGKEHLDALQASSATLAKAIGNGTVTIRQIDRFIGQHPQLFRPLKQHLLAKKAWLLSHDGKLEEALQVYDDALRVDEGSPSTWVLKGCVLLQLERIDEAFRAFDQAYSLRAKFGAQKQGHLGNLFGVWSISSLLIAFFGILQQDSREAEKGVREYLSVLDKARAENLQAAVLNLAVEKPVSKKVQEALQELELMVRLLAIRDPFERWRALTKEISIVWPQGVSAVDAIREQRE
jgi:tetratricopeptide (TPR) repeat protein